MSILREALKKFGVGLRRITGQPTELQAIGSVFAASMTAKQRMNLQGNLTAVQFCIDIAAMTNPTDSRVKSAKLWVDGAIDAVGE